MATELCHVDIRRLPAWTPITAKYGAPGRDRGKHRRRVGLQVVQQVENLVAERGVEPGPSLGHRDRCFEGERTLAREPAGVVDRARRRVVAITLRDAGLVDEQSQETTAVAPGIEHAAPSQVDFDRVEHRLPEEAVLVLHRLVVVGASPVRLAHGGDASDGPCAASESDDGGRAISGLKRLAVLP